MHDVIMKFLDARDGVTYLGTAYVKVPGVDVEATIAAVIELAEQKRVALIALRKRNGVAESADVATRQSLLNGVKQIEQANAKGHLGPGVAIDIFSMGNSAAIRKANAATIRKYKALAATLRRRA